MPDGPVATAAGEAVLALLGTRAHDATVCPSEVARTLAAAGPDAGDWRAMMPAVHTAVDLLLAEGRVRLGWKGKPLGSRAGPYRIGHADRAF